MSIWDKLKLKICITQDFGPYNMNMGIISHLCWCINTPPPPHTHKQNGTKQNIIKVDKYLLLVKFRHFPFIGCRKVENVSGQSEVGPKNTNLVGDIEYLRPISSNSVQWLQRRRRKCPSQTDAKEAILGVFWSARNIQRQLLEEVKLPVKFCAISFSWCREVQNLSIRGHSGHLGFPICPKKHKLCGGRKELAASSRVSSN